MNTARLAELRALARLSFAQATERYAQARLWWQRWRWYEQNGRPWNRARIQVELAKRQCYARWPLEGNVLAALRDGRLRLGPHVHFEPHAWIAIADDAKLTIGGGTFINQGVMVAAIKSVAIGEHCMFANGCFITDGNHRYDDPGRPVPWQGFTVKGPTVIGDNVWAGANVVITSGVTIGRRSVIGAGAVVTNDIPPFSVAAGIPARVISSIEYNN